ncbi:DUF4350 domain-containing protein [Actinoplanes sp. NPDC051859]|uniref:DUF4350 domain-containing protein n=1 Tax=Actinoplanes sp. NPDC051859 TaxID=3363909 RepID=UPI003792A312
MKNPRRLRLIVPFAVVLGLATATGIVHAVEQPDPEDITFLSPTSDAGDGAKQLADGLTRAGVTVDVRKDSPQALTALATGDEVTLFITTPELVHPSYLRRFSTQSNRVRVVLVAPTQRQLDDAWLDVRVGGPRWTAAAPEPDCTITPAAAAGPAAALRWRYEALQDTPQSCYDGGLVELGRTGQLSLVGAADPFRNDRADEHGNQRLALGLLSRSSRVVWLDLHEREPAPERTRPPVAPTADPRDPWGTGDSQGDRADGSGSNGSGDGRAGDPEDSAQGSGRSEQEQDNPLLNAFPPGVWAALLLLVLAAIALALASARRLGSPVTEPLPARVRAAETVRGLGGLYRRAGARSTSLRTVQSAARSRLIEHFGLPSGTSVDELAARVAAETALPTDDVRHALGGGTEDSDAELVRAATVVQNLVRFVTGGQNWHHEDEGNLT